MEEFPHPTAIVGINHSNLCSINNIPGREKTVYCLLVERAGHPDVHAHHPCQLLHRLG